MCVVVVFCWCVVVGGGGVWCGVVCCTLCVLWCCVVCFVCLMCFVFGGVWLCCGVVFVVCVCAYVWFVGGAEIYFVVRILMRQWQSGRLCMRYRKKNAPRAFKIPRRTKWVHRQSKMVELVHALQPRTLNNISWSTRNSKTTGGAKPKRYQ